MTIFPEARKTVPVKPTTRPHVLGVDDAPFDKRQSAPVTIVGVAMAGHDLVEAVAVGAFPVDGDGAAEYLAGWIGRMRIRPTLRAVILGGITICGLGIVDLTELAARLGLPVLAVTRRNPAGSDARGRMTLILDPAVSALKSQVDRKCSIRDCGLYCAST